MTQILDTQPDLCQDKLEYGLPGRAAQFLRILSGALGIGALLALYWGVRSGAPLYLLLLLGGLGCVFVLIGIRFGRWNRDSMGRTVLVYANAFQDHSKVVAWMREKQAGSRARSGIT